MADLNPTLADVALYDDSADTEIVTAGEAFDQLMPLYRHTDGRYYKADANVSELAAAVRCISIGRAAAAGAKVLVVKKGPIVPGAVLTVAGLYILSATAGKICPYGDLASASWLTLLGGGRTAGIFDVNIRAFGCQKP